LIRLSKSKGKDKDTLEKAKQVGLGKIFLLVRVLQGGAK